MSPGHAVLPCRRLPDFVVATDATTRCRRERIPTAMESAIRARFVRDSFHSLITALSLSRNGVVRQCGVVDLARFAQSGLLRSRFACFLPIAAIAPICVPPHLGSALHRSRGNKGIRRRWRGRTALGSACDGDSIGATFGRQSRTFRAGGPARMAFAGNVGSRYPAETRCARLQALLCADRTS